MISMDLCLSVRISLMCLCFKTILAEYHKVIEWTAPPELKENGLFGFSVVFQSSSEFKRLLVGAPTAFTTGRVYYTSDLQNNDWKPKLPASCSNTNTSAIGSCHNLLEAKTWFGASIAASTSYYVACAPRSTIDYTAMDKTKSLLMGGKCYVEMDKSDRLEEMSVITKHIRERNNSLVTFADTFGWNIHITKGHNILVGGPGVHESARGAVMIYNGPSSSNPAYCIKPYYYDVEMIRHNLGYSVSSGNYFSNVKSESVFAIGSTYGDTGFGTIIFIKNKMTVHKIVDVEVGSMFAAALCSTDLDKDGRSDLLVGAPTANSRAADYDVGAVHVFFSDVKEKLLVRKWTLWGGKSGGRFGSTILAIGDMDGDKKDEIVIAAPYEDDGRGAIYVYSSEALCDVTTPTYAQRIEPSAFVQVGYFGYSAAAFKQLDGTFGLAVGSPGENKLAVLHHIPSFGINIVLKNNLAERNNFTTFEFETCLVVHYRIGPKDMIADLETSITISHLHAKIAPDGKNSFAYNINLKDIVNKMNCTSIIVNTPIDGDYSKQIMYKVVVRQLSDPRKEAQFVREHALLSKAPLSKQGSLWAKPQCKNPGKCIPVLMMSWNTSLQQTYMVGSTKMEQISVSLHNSGETAYNVIVKLEVTGVTILKTPASCDMEENGILACDPRVMFHGSNWASGDIVLETSSITSEESEIAIKVQLYIDGDLLKKEEKVLQLLYDTQGVSVTGKMDRSVLVEVTSNQVYYEGKFFEHTYLIMNSGITNWVDLRCLITLRKEPYLKYEKIKIFTPDSYLDCPYVPGTNDSSTEVTCNIGNLKSKDKIEMFVAMSIIPNTLGDVLDKRNITVNSTVVLMDTRGAEIKSDRISTLVMMRKAIMNWWIVVAGVLFGLCLIAFIIFILYEVGFLKRKKKENLQNLQRRASRRMSMRSSVVRNSVRQSLSDQNPNDDKRRRPMIVDQRRRSVLVDPEDAALEGSCRQRCKTDGESQPEIPKETNVIVHQEINKDT